MIAFRKSSSLNAALRDTARRNLVQRVLSAAVLAPIAITAVYLGGPPFAAVIAFMAMVMVYEWARMVEGIDFSPAFCCLAISGAIALAAAAGGFFSIAFLMAAGGAGAAAFALRKQSAKMAWAAFGALYITVPCIALVWLRDVVENGRALTFVLFLIVWSADTGAYFAGRFIGGPRISRALSPEKNMVRCRCWRVYGRVRRRRSRAMDLWRRLIGGLRPRGSMFRTSIHIR